MKILVGGVFDLFHFGHLSYLKSIRKLWPKGEIVVAVNTDEFCEAYKRKPIMTSLERVMLIMGLDIADSVIMTNSPEDFSRNIELTKPNVIVTSDDWASKDYYAQAGVTREYLEEMEIQLVYLPRTQGISTTEIIKRCKSQKTK